MNYIYRVYDEADHLLYIGVTIDVGTRLSQHAREKEWWWLVERATYQVVSDDREYAEREERAAIWNERPRFNIRGADWTLKNAQWEEIDWLSDISMEQRAWDELERQTEFSA